MSTLLIRRATLLATLDAQRREIADGAVYARDGVIEAVGTTAQLPDHADEVIDARGQVVIAVGGVNDPPVVIVTLPLAVAPPRLNDPARFLKSMKPTGSI